MHWIKTELLKKDKYHDKCAENLWNIKFYDIKHTDAYGAEKYNIRTILCLATVYEYTTGTLYISLDLTYETYNYAT